MALLSQYSYNSLPVGSILQTLYTATTGIETYTGNNLASNTTNPTITDGHGVLSLPFALTNVNNYALLHVNFFVSNTSGTENVVMLFANNTLIGTRYHIGAYDGAMINFIVKHSPLTTNSVTYSVRCAAGSGDLYVNRAYIYNFYQTGKTFSTLMAQEIKG